jgi:lipopolysaccharide transport system ATP-binding protein
MSDYIIKVENLGKRYRIHHGERERYTALRDVLARGAAAPLRWLRRQHGAWSDKHGAESNGNGTNPQSAPSVGSSLPAPGSLLPACEEFWALRGVSFEVKQGEVLGIIGRNGAGKSTLLKILSRITEPTEGRVRIRGRVASLLEVGTGFHPELTGRENIYLNGAILGMRKVEIQRKFDEIVAFAEVEKFLDTPVKRYSSGMYVRLAFAVAAHLEPEILIVDEVLAVGDGEFQKKCLGKMKDVAGHGRTVLFVSHNMPAVSSLCSRAILVDAGRVRVSGAPADVVLRYYSTDQESPAMVDFTKVNRPIGDSFGQLLSGAVRNAIGDICSDFSLDEPVTIEMRFRILVERESGKFFPYPSLHFYSSGGECVFYTSPPNSQNGPLHPGDYVAICHVPAQLLNTGSYFVGFGLAHCDNGVHVNFYEANAVSFHVSEDMEQTIDRRNGYSGTIPGLLRPVLNWSITPKSDRPLQGFEYASSS